MFGITDPSIWMAYLFVIGGTLVCVVYGVLNWNKSDKEDESK